MQGPVSMTSAQRRLVEEEDKFRRLFAEDASSRELQDPHVLLEDVFSLGPHQWTFQDEDAEEKKVPKLLEQNRQPVAHGRAIVDSKDQFLTNWETFTKGMFKGLDWTNIFIAGGAVLACLQPDGMTKYPTSDIDIFVHGIDDNEQANNLLKHIHSTIKANTQGEGIVIRTRRTVTIINSYPYRHTQVILRLYKSPAQVLLGFDVDCCTFGYDGNTVWAMERGRRALTKRYNLVNPSRRSLTYESRLFKYSKRGFAVAVPDLDKSRVNQKLLGPTATPSQFQGLAKLLVYDHRLSNPVPFYGKAREQADEAKSDYDGDLIIPWGPGLTASAILHQLNATDKSQFFANKMKDMRSGNTGAATHKHLFVPGLDDLITGQFWCSTCAQKVELPEEEPLGIFVQRKVEWDRNALSYQDFDNGFKRTLFTGSFQVKLNDDWALGAYQDGASGQQTPTRPATASFSSQTSVTPSSYSAGQLSSPSRATPVLSATVSRGKLSSPKKSSAKVASPSGALPSFASSYNQAAPSPAKKEPEDGQFVCEYCKMSFLSQNQLYRHVRMTGHILQEPGSLSIASSSSVSPYASASSSASSLYTPPSSSSSYLAPASSYSQPYATAPSSPPRSPAPVTIPISPSQIYSAPTPLEFRSSSAADDLSQFGPQPGGSSLYFTMPSPSPASDASSAYGYYGGASPSQPASVVEAPQASQPYGGASSYGTFGSSSLGLPWEGKQVRDEMTKALLLLGALKRQHKINDEERAVLKRLAIEGSDVLLACVQVYEIENDEEDLAHTLQRLALHHRK